MVQKTTKPFNGDGLKRRANCASRIESVYPALRRASQQNANQGTGKNNLRRGDSQKSLEYVGDTLSFDTCQE
eukprot:4356492-Amphidinium_carterae.1